MSAEGYLEKAQPLDVHLASSDVDLGSRTPQRQAVRTVVYTVVLSAGVPARLLLPNAPAREYAVIQALDTAVVVCDSQGQAQAPSNDTTTLPSPEGSVVPVGVVVPLLGTNELWVTAPVFPARVSVVAAYCE